MLLGVSPTDTISVTSQPGRIIAIFILTLVNTGLKQDEMTF